MLEQLIEPLRTDSLKDVFVLRFEELILSGKASELFEAKNLISIHLSLSHDGGNAIAMVVLESK